MVDRLVKRSGSYDLKRISEAEEDYLAWQLANSLYSATAGQVGVVSTSSSGGTIVGAFTDTFFNQAVGTHPGTSITSSSTVTTLYQNFGTMTETDMYPVISTGGVNIKATNDSQLNTICDRIIAKTFGNSYSSYYLASSTPAGYSLHQSAVFSDTRTDGTSVTYNLYKKNLPTAPTAIRPLKLQNNKNDPDLEVMTDAEIRGVFAARSRNRIAVNGIGSYQLRSATQGAPTVAGTWVARGTAVDTKQIVSEQDYIGNYTRNSTRASTRDSTSNFTRNSTRISNIDYSGAYTRNRVSTYSGAYSGAYTRNSTSDFVGDFIGNYTADYIGTYTGNDNTSYERYYSGYLTYYLGDPVFYTGTVNSTSSYAGGVIYYGAEFGGYAGTAYYIGDFIGERNFQGAGYYDGATYLQNYTRNSTNTFVGDFIGNYTGAYTGNYSQTFIGNYTGAYTGIDYTGDYTGDFVGNFIGNYGGDYTGNYAGNYIASTITSSTEDVEIYTLYLRTA